MRKFGDSVIFLNIIGGIFGKFYKFLGEFEKNNFMEFLLRVDEAVHHYINFVSIFSVVCVSSLTRHPTPTPSGRRAIGSSSHQNTLLSGNVFLLPRCLLRIRCCAPTDLCCDALYIYINTQIYSHPPPLLGCLEASSHLSYVLHTADKVYILLLRCTIYYIIYLFPPATQVTCRGIKGQTVPRHRC